MREYANFGENRVKNNDGIVCENIEEGGVDEGTQIQSMYLIDLSL